MLAPPITRRSCRAAVRGPGGPGGRWRALGKEVCPMSAAGPSAASAGPRGAREGGGRGESVGGGASCDGAVRESKEGCQMDKNAWGARSTQLPCRKSTSASQASQATPRWSLLNCWSRAGSPGDASGKEARTRCDELGPPPFTRVFHAKNTWRRLGLLNPRPRGVSSQLGAGSLDSRGGPPRTGPVRGCGKEDT